MARDRARDGIYVEKPKTDVYVVMLILSTICMALACLFMKFAANN